MKLAGLADFKAKFGDLTRLHLALCDELDRQADPRGKRIADPEPDAERAA